MLRFGLIATALAALFLTTAAEAKGHKGNAAHQNCPPGLAKKNPPCVPPGQARKSEKSKERAEEDRAEEDRAESDAVTRHRPGDTLRDDYVVLIDPNAYPPGLDPVYVRYGNFLYVIDRNTGIVLDQLGPVSDWGLPASGVTGRVIGRDTLFDPYGVGDRLPTGYTAFLDPQRYARTPDPLFVRQGDTIYLIDRTTGLIREIIGLFSQLFR